MTDKQLKQVNKIVEYAQVFYTRPELITEQETIKRYNDILQQYGKEAADNSLTATLKNFKGKAKKTENIELQKLKNKMFERVGWCPSSLREIKRMRDTGELQKYIS